MRNPLLGILLCLSLTPAFSQKAPVKFGDVTKEEIEMTTYDKDPTAEAVILADYGISMITYRQNVGFTLDFERTTRIKVLKKEGLSWGDFTIPLYKRQSEEEKLISIKAVTYNLEGGKVVESKLKNDGIFKEVYDANWDHMKITCPNVKEGSVIEIAYKVNSPFLVNFQDWQFQERIPTVISEYRAQIPEFFTYDKYLQGYIALEVSDEKREPNSIRLVNFVRGGGSPTESEQISYLDSKFRWVATNVPAFKPEPHMTAVHDYISRMNFELSYIKMPNQPVKPILGSWDDINKTMAESEYCGLQITGNGFLKKTVDQITAGLTTDAEKIGAIANYVKENVAWNGNQRMYPSESLKKVLEAKKGNSADINLLLGSMLEKAGLTVRPVLISTREHGLVRTSSPVLGQFNYIICLVESGDKAWLLDATERLLPIGVLPERCLNGQGLAVSKQGMKWVSLETKLKSRSVTSGEFVLTESGDLSGKLKLDCSGYAALRNRKKYLVDGESEYLKSFIGSRQWDVKSTTFENTKEIQNNFIQQHEVTISESMTVAGDVIYIDPFIINGMKENPFKTAVREYPVDFGSPMENTFHLKLTLPEGYVIDELPSSKVLALPENAGRFIYNVAQTGNMITVTSMFHINKGLFTQLEYPDLREFYNQVVAKHTEQIVLKKKQ